MDPHNSTPGRRRGQARTSRRRRRQKPAPLPATWRADLDLLRLHLILFAWQDPRRWPPALVREALRQGWAGWELVGGRYLLADRRRCA